MECGILNLDDTTGNRTHWVVWYRDNGKNYYFDSYSIQPPNELKRYLKSPIFYNTELVMRLIVFIRAVEQVVKYLDFVVCFYAITYR